LFINYVCKSVKNGQQGAAHIACSWRGRHWLTGEIWQEKGQSTLRQCWSLQWNTTSDTRTL